MIDELTTRADDSDLIALLATSRKARLDNVALARELRDVVVALKRELHYRQSLTDLTIDRNSSWITGSIGAAQALIPLRSGK